LGLGESKKEKIFSVKKRKEEETKNRSLISSGLDHSTGIVSITISSHRPEIVSFSMAERDERRRIEASERHDSSIILCQSNF
jgi:hypothetical protein